MTPDALKFNEHIQGDVFQTGVEFGKWGVVDDDPLRPTWPNITIWVTASPKPNCPDRYYFMFELTNYPAQPPTACIWDITNKLPLPMAQRPSGPKLVSAVFQSGHLAGTCLYTPLDRRSREGHADWPIRHPHLWWVSTFTIVNYLKYIYELLNSNDYASS